MIHYQKLIEWTELRDSSQWELVVYMRGNGMSKQTREMVEDVKYYKMELCMKDIGRIISSVEEED
jgi:hypothetical protein